MNHIGHRERQMIGIQHAKLRVTIRAAQEAARDAAAGKEAADHLRAMVQRLCREVLDHLASEEQILLPFLSRHDDRSELHGSLMRAEHSHQRAVLSMLANFATWLTPDAVAERVLALCDHLLSDMEFEERELLSAAADEPALPR